MQSFTNDNKVTMKTPPISKKQSDSLTLLIDKQGDIGKAILLQMRKVDVFGYIVFATRNYTSLPGQDVLFCPFQNTMPLFPNEDYSHIIVIYNGEADVLHALSGLLKKAHESGGAMFVCVPIRFYTKIVAEKIQATGQHPIIIGDIFGENILQEGTTIADFFKQAKKEEKIVISGMGMESAYPVYIDDVSAAIVRAIFVKKEKKVIWMILPPHPPTKLSLARMFQKIDPILRIDLVGEEEKNTVALPTDGVYLLENNYSVEEKIKHVYKQEMAIVINTEDRRQIEDKKTPKNVRILLFRFMFFFCVFLLLPVLSTIFFMILGWYDLWQAKNALLHGDVAKMEAFTKKGEKFLQIADKTRLVFNTVPFPQKNMLLAKIDENISQEKTVAALFLEISKLTKSFQKKDSVSIEMSARKSLALLQEVKINGGDKKIPLFSTTVLSNMVGIFPDIAGFTRPKTYLVLLQNNMELRPGGGFIGSFAIAKVNKGDVEFSLHDVYDADGQLKGHIEPPFPIRRHLKSIHWYLRDSNYYANFPTSASASAFFIKEETGEVVDGVIAVDVSFVKMLVGAFGKIEVPDYKETITKDNFYTVVQNHAEKDFFAGSTQKKDFLQSLFRAIQARLNQKNVPYQLLYTTLLQGFGEKHVMVASREQPIQNIFVVNNMSSSLHDGRRKKDSLRDYMGISEANVGVNKANVGIARSLSYDVAIDNKASVSAKLTIWYKNEKNNNTYAADYKNYLRIIAPYGSVLTSISIDNDEKKLIPAVIDPKVYEAKKFVAPTGLEVAIEEENNKTLFGFLVNVPLGQETTIVAKYMLPQSLPALPSSFTYDLLLYKQPGTEVYPVTFSLQCSENYGVIKTTDGFTKKANALQKEILFTSDVNMNVLFSAK